ncbi:MAG: hypothetical protein SFY92_07515 [Verrucomicrobiae bacterium]|nr:hypothetical protein [Verrucomicrobiae bacterium]
MGHTTLRPLLCAFLTCLVWIPATQAATAKPLKPVRQTVKSGKYVLNVVNDKKQDPASAEIRVIIRVTLSGDKKPIKPEAVYLENGDGGKIGAEDREDRKVGNEENTGLPLSVSPGYQSGSGGSVGVGLDLGKLFGPDGEYSYSKVDFKRTDFVAGRKLVVVMPDDSVIRVPLKSIAK